MPISRDSSQNEIGSSRNTNTNINNNTVGLLSLPREVLGLIAEHIYDPLILTQQDRLSKYPPSTIWNVSEETDP